MYYRLLSSVELSLNFLIYTMIFKRARKKIICWYKCEKMIFKAPPHKANKLSNHLIWVHNNQNISIAWSCKIVSKTNFLKRAHCGRATCNNCLLWYFLLVPAVEQNTSQRKDKWILPLPLEYAKLVVFTVEDT